MSAAEVVLDPGEVLSTSPNTLGRALRRFVRAPTALILCTLFLATASYRISLGHWSWVEAIIPFAILAFWPFQEWLIHVFILHFKPKKLGPITIDLPVAKKHRYHHRNPWDIDKGFMPLHAVFLSMPVLYGLWFGLAPTKEIAATGAMFWVLFSLHYEWVHFIVHTRYKPKNAYYQYLWRNHRLHHCKNENYWQGVTMTFGDRVFGTQPDPKSVPISDTCRTLGVAD